MPTVPHPDFIEIYDDVLTVARCRALIERFEASGLSRRGETGGGVDVAIKDSWDIALQEHPSWSDAQQMLNDAVLAGFKRYLRRYPHIALATSRLQLPRSDGGANLQKYFADKGSYPYWHCELHPSPEDQGESLHRVVLWTIYLNDNFSEGETSSCTSSAGSYPREARC